MAAWLKKQNWPPGSRIVILARNCAWWMIADFAIWMAGHVSVPFFPAASRSTLTSLFQHCEPVACFLGRFDYELDLQQDIFKNITFLHFPNTTATYVPSQSTPWAGVVATETPLLTSPVRGALEPATIIYTSGTTGQPKGAIHSFQSLSLMGKSMEPAFTAAMTGDDSILSYLPLAHIAERAIVEMNALFMRLHIFFVDSQDTFLDDLKRSRSTFFFSVPRLYIRFQQKVFETIPQKKLNRLLAIPWIGSIVNRKLLRRLGLNHARLVAGGGAATPVETIQWYRKLGLEFVEGYGMTETGITHVPLPGQYRVGYVGNSSLYALTRISADGEVQIAGPMNMLGYYRNPELTRQAFTADDYFRTGDRGEIDTAGRLKLIGRLKEEFKTSKGKFVIPAHIEKLLTLSPAIESVAIFGAGMTLPFALIVLVQEKRAACTTSEGRADTEAELKSLLTHVNSELEQYERLRFLVICDQPWTTENSLLTPTLKVCRPALERSYSDRFSQWEKMGCEVVWLESR
jgi:long-chain acyl-CoA synthetase